MGANVWKEKLSQDAVKIDKEEQEEINQKRKN